MSKIAKSGILDYLDRIIERNHEHMYNNRHIGKCSEREYKLHLQGMHTVLRAFSEELKNNAEGIIEEDLKGEVYPDEVLTLVQGMLSGMNVLQKALKEKEPFDKE